jgi:LmbE family N-acetylglucosaminyl deacetylase
MLVLTKSEFSTKKYSRTAATAWNEGIAGAKELGISDVRTAGLSSVAWDAAAVGKIDAIIEEVRPSMVLGHWPFDTHQDHHNASWATLSSCRRIKTIMAYEPMAPSGRGFVPFRPQVYFDISSSIDKKKAAIAAHASQMEKYGEEWVEAAIARAKTHGWAAGVAYAEVFELARMVV